MEHNEHKEPQRALSCALRVILTMRCLLRRHDSENNLRINNACKMKIFDFLLLTFNFHQAFCNFL